LESFAILLSVTVGLSKVLQGTYCCGTDWAEQFAIHATDFLSKSYLESQSVGQFFGKTNNDERTQGLSSLRKRPISEHHGVLRYLERLIEIGSVK